MGVIEPSAGQEGSPDSLFFPSSGQQADSLKPSNPEWSLPKASRETEHKVYISEKHKQDVVGRDSPGPAYIPRRQRSLPSWGFGTAVARPPPALAQYPEASNDLLKKRPDSQVFKYKTTTASKSIAPRSASIYQPDFDGYPSGVISPGPQHYSPSKDSSYCHRMEHCKGADNIPPKYTMRVKTKIKELESQTPPAIGPGVYPVQEACMPQASSEKPSKPRWSFSKGDRFSMPRDRGEWQLRDGEGYGKIKFQRSFSQTPSYSFGTSTRQHRKKVAPIILPQDMGPAEDLGKIVKDHPTMHTRKDVIRYTDCPAGRN